MEYEPPGPVVFGSAGQSGLKPSVMTSMTIVYGLVLPSIESELKRGSECNLTKSGSISWAPGYDASNNHYLVPATYDAAGNVLYDLTNTYTWDVYGNMASARSGRSAAVCGTSGTCHTYDALGRAVEKNASGTYKQILYSPLGKTAIMSGQTTNNAYVPLPGGESSMWDAPGGHHVEHRDWRGS
jgi:hypothetical protein